MSLVGRAARNHPQQVTGNDRRWHATDAIDDRATTWDDFDQWHARFGFTIDVAAAHHNAKCARYYDAVTNGLERNWGGERVWCNPPYSNIRPWVQKAWESWATDTGRAEVIVMLLPANRTEQTWWQELVEPALRARRSDFGVEFLPGRLRFLKPGETEVPPNSRPPFGCCLLIWQPRHTARIRAQMSGSSIITPGCSTTSLSGVRDAPG